MATLRLAWRYLSYHAARSVVLVLGVALTVFLPVAVELLVDEFSAELAARAESTPLVAGAKGSRYDLVLGTLYFEGRTPTPLSMAEVEDIAEGGLALPIPVLARHRAKGFPVVGTTHDYYSFRGLVAAEGSMPLVLGDCVLGSGVAAELALGPGDTLLTDQENLYDLTQGYPLRMNVVGVLARSGTPDDRAVFCDLKTTWIVEGIGHGHQDAESQGEDQVLEREGDTKIALNASVMEFTHVTGANVDSFHFHGAPEDLPVTGVLVVPNDAKSSTLLKGRFRVSETGQLLVPTEVIGELLGFVLHIKTFFDANAVLVTLAMGLFLGVIVLLSVQVRQRELSTLSRIGCARSMIVRLFATELALVVGAGILVALGLAALAVPVLGRFVAPM